MKKRKTIEDILDTDTSSYDDKLEQMMLKIME